MAELEDVYKDVKSWYYFKDDSETVGVYARCPECGRYITEGKLKINMGGEVKLEGWICKKHGEVRPYFDRML